MNLIDSNRIAIVTMHNEPYQDLANVTLPNIEDYAKLHNYKFFCKNTNFTNDYLIYFDKPKFILDTFNDNDIDWIWWIDVDAIITNYSIQLQFIIDDRYEIIMSTDGAALNCGSFLVRNSFRSKAWLEMVYANRFVKKYVSDKWPEQLVMIETARNYTNILKIVPQKTFNSYYLEAYKGLAEVAKYDRLGTSSNWTPGDFVIHMPGISNLIRIEFFKLFVEKLVMKSI